MTEGSYHCPCGWSRVILDDETEEDARRKHEAADIHRLALEFPPGVDMCRDCGGAHPIYGRCLGEPRRKYADGCERCRLIYNEYGGFGPYHDASDQCESGSRTHCSCDPCF